MTVMIDTASRDVTGHFGVGKRPARNLVFVFPESSGRAADNAPVTARQ
jgi:hypothetical protein